MNGMIFDIKEMAVHDGPGLRTTVFFKGCPLRCKWCHNPESFIQKPQVMFKENKCIKCGKCNIKCSHPECQILGRCMHMCPENCMETIGEKYCSKKLAEELKLSANVLGSSFGGFTFSGGEPLLQHEFLLELCSHLKGYHLCIETSGYADSEVFKKVVDTMDFIIMDIKLADSELHRKYTGVDNSLIIKNFKILKNSNKPYLIRTPLIPGICDTEDNLSAIKEIIGESKWEKIPYNNMAGAKYKMLDMNYSLDL